MTPPSHHTETLSISFVYWTMDLRIGKGLLQPAARNEGIK